MKNKRYTIILSTLSMLESIFMLTIPYLTSSIVDYATKGNKDMVIPYSIALGIAALGCILSKVTGILLYSKFSLDMEKEMKSELYDILSKKGFQDLSVYHSAEIEMLYTTDIDNVIHKKLSTIPSFVRIITRFILAVSLLIYYDWKFLLVLVIFGILGLFAAKAYSKIMKPRHKKVLEKCGKSNSFIVESFSQLKIIQAYQANIYANSYYQNLLEEEIKAKRKRNYLLYGSNAMLYVFSCVAYVGPILYGAFGILNSWFTYGVMIALIQLVSQVENPLIQFSPLLNQYNLSKTSEERLSKAMSIPNLKESERILDFDSILFENVSFSYNLDHKVLENFSCQMNKQDTILLSGPSGIGKTTLFMLLMGFLTPNEGKIYYVKDDIKKELDSSMLSLFSYVPQENILFSGTIYDNLKILTGKEEKEMIDALKAANIYDEIMAMPNGIYTELKDRGQGLSLGQIQRILIAAAILHDAPILLLDEFSSALDSKNEDIIISNLKNMNKTIIYITHRNKHMEGQRVITLKDLNNKEE